MLENIILQIGLPADACIQFFFGIFEHCVNISSKDISLLSSLALISSIALPGAIGLVAYFFVRKATNRSTTTKKNNP
jgi:hypothetical protein